MAFQHLTEETGEISTEKTPFMYVEWKVPDDIFSHQNAVHKIDSPSFRFKDTAWNLRLVIHSIIPGVNSWCGGTVNICMVKKNPATSTLRVTYNIGIKTVSGNTYQSNRGEIASKFETDFVCCGIICMLYSSDLSLQKSSLSSNGVLTFFCCFWMETVGNLDVVPGKELFEDQSQKITSELVTENTFGEISTETSHLKYVEWKVSDKLLLFQDSKQTIRSPSFQFKDATWYLQLTKNSPEFTCVYGSKGTIILYLARKDCADPTSHVDYTVGIKTVDGNLYRTQRGELVFHKNAEYHVWVSELSTLDKNIILEPNGVVNFFCYFRLENSDSLVAVSTTTSQGYAADKLASLTSLSASSPSDSDCTSKEEQLPTGLEKLGTDLKNLFISGEDSDVTIRVKNKEFKAHKCILRARSPVFYSMFTHDMAEKNRGTVDITDCDPDAFEIFLLCLYSGNMENLSTNTVFDLYRAADKYDAAELKLTCKEFMLNSLSVDTVCDVVEHALQCDETELLKTATEFFAKNLKNVILTVKWQSFLKNNPVATNELLIKATNYYVLKK